MCVCLYSVYIYIVYIIELCQGILNDWFLGLPCTLITHIVYKLLLQTKTKYGQTWDGSGHVKASH